MSGEPHGAALALDELLLDTKPALAAIEQYRPHDDATCVLAFAAAARLADCRGDRDDTNRQLASAITTFGFSWPSPSTGWRDDSGKGASA